MFTVDTIHVLNLTNDIVTTNKLFCILQN